MKNKEWKLTNMDGISPLTTTPTGDLVRATMEAHVCNAEAGITHLAQCMRSALVAKGDARAIAMTDRDRHALLAEAEWHVNRMRNELRVYHYDISELLKAAEKVNSANYEAHAAEEAAAKAAADGASE